MASRKFLLLALSTIFQVVLSQWKCDYQIYGRPQLDHCAGALTSMPDATAKSPTTKLAARRKFVEPQYLEPPFNQCHNGLDVPMEQLPKFWRSKSCRFALAILPTPTGRVVDPSPVSSWAFILKNAHKLSTNCLGRRLGGGVIFIADPLGDGSMALYAYAVGSPFEAILNNYMITSLPIFPPGVSSTSNGILTGIGANGSLELVYPLEDT